MQRKILNTKKLLLLFITVLFCTGFIIGCGNNSSDNKEIVIWTSGEDYKNEFYLNSLKEQFPDYNITLEYMNSSNIAAKVREEGDKAQVDIICSEEYNYLYMIQDYLAEITDIEYNVFLDNIIPENHKFTPELRSGGCIIINKKVLDDKGVSVPTSYEELLNPKYKNLISMPNPASSGTGYMFLRQLTNEWGEDEAFKYFDKLSENVLQYTSSGSGPVNALIQGEAGIGLGMISQAVTEINNGADLDITFFDEGAPFSMYGNAIMSKSSERKEVQEVFHYLATELCKQDNERYFPEQIYKDFTPEIKNFPKNINYGNMKNDTLEEKERLLKKWTFS